MPDLPGVRLHLADDVAVASRLAAAELAQADPDLPYWAFAWAGGLGIARYLMAHPGEVAGRNVLDVATGSGLCAIVAARAGAQSVRAIDTDPLSAAAVALNSRANGVRVGFTHADVPSTPPPPECDVILAGDVCYQEEMGSRMIEWLHEAARGGTRVLIGDPGRTYLPPGLERVACYRVRTSRELEDAAVEETFVFTLPTPPGVVARGGRDAGAD